MLLKKKDPHLKIYIAIGGWAFNDPGPTQTTFSDLAASLPRQKAFIGSLLSFMSTYGFDGVDLDWEYPEAPDRAGRGVDYTNFPIFMKRMKETLAFVDKGLTITLPASYWYLQHFDIIKLVSQTLLFPQVLQIVNRCAVGFVAHALCAISLLRLSLHQLPLFLVFSFLRSVSNKTPFLAFLGKIH